MIMKAKLIISIIVSTFVSANFDDSNELHNNISFSGLQFLEQGLQYVDANERAYLAIYLNHTEFESN